MHTRPLHPLLRSLLLSALLTGGASALDAQTPEVIHACYVPLTGTVYRIKEPDIRQACSSTSHIEFQWTDGADAIRNGDATDGFAVTGTLNTGSIPVEGDGVRLMWYPGKAAFRVGRVNGTQWDDANVGGGSVALGLNTTSSGQVSTALGNSTVASAGASTAMGFATTASGIGSTAMGNGSDATGDRSTAMGGATTASGNSSTAMGSQTFASGFASTAMGSLTQASGTRSTAMGEGTVASGDFSTAMGRAASTNGQTGTFVYGDASTSTSLLAGGANQFMVRAAGGTTFFSNSALTSGVTLAAGGGAWQTVSDVSRKHLFREESGEDALEKIATMPIRSWSYQSQDASIRHLGPTAQDFRAAFGLGESELTITTTDIDGVALLAIQALEKRTREENAALRAENMELREKAQEVDALRVELAELRARLERLEQARR